MDRRYEDLLAEFVDESRRLFGSRLVGVYLHGSAAMGCFNPEKSDLDLLVVVDGALPDDVKRAYMDMTVRLNRAAPAKGLEMSVVRRACCRPFEHPMPFELHFSNAHLAWYLSAPEDYVARMKGVDRDLAAHVTVLCRRGYALYGAPVPDVFDEPDRAAYLDSLRYDIDGAASDVLEDPVYVILNLCRVLAYLREGLVLSKKEGGVWALERLPAEWRAPVREALAAYASGAAMEPVPARETAFAVHMLESVDQIAGRRAP